ncbi:MAG: lysophospholipase [Actinomycetes bacterium]|jgi:alpha-beta hydrolase superfamily lysophospholipase|nr:lysophospholipase [Actinomycetes bacterium]
MSEPGVNKTLSGFPSAARYEGDIDYATISVKTWQPASTFSDGTPPRAILQLNHGMVEYIDRYEAFARAATNSGFLVVGMDFIGHGDSAPDALQLGHTGRLLADGGNVLLRDMDTLRHRTQQTWPDVPYFMFGHSMGSFVLRAYLAQHGAGLGGAIICGTGTVPAGQVGAAKVVLGLLGLFHKPDYHSPFFKKLTLGSYNGAFEKAAGGARTEFDWLSRDDAQVDAYIADPRCGGTFSLAANRVLIDVFQRANAPSAYSTTPTDLPLLIISGARDPVGGNGAGVRAVADAYRAAGVTDVTCELYPEARHEILNETNRLDVMADILNWMNARITDDR